MKGQFDTTISGFKPISLSEMNAQASFLDRIDTKYLVSEKEFAQVLEKLQEDFYVLDIGGKNVFSYDSVYMDTDEYLFYKQHQNKEATRTKVRTRLYVESNLAFFEYKQKENGTTRKFRYEFPSEEHGKMTKGKKRFFEGVYMSFYGQLPGKISPTLSSKYSRLTLCAKDSGERLTVDFNIRLKDLRKEGAKKVELNNVVIIESKSTASSCRSHEIMEEMGIKKAKSCSKYCLGLIYNEVHPFPGVFEETIEKLESLRNEK
ncbi:MAG: polyphosphate polymerase domain-containing protein [Candidatus Peribacteria bacterium]|nr:MAG: polyphosphate polymerase domain-containing protein [Candidatus Peribacteria bacterium]